MAKSVLIPKKKNSLLILAIILGSLLLGMYFFYKDKPGFFHSSFSQGSSSHSNNETQQVENFATQVKELYPSLGGYPPMFSPASEETHIRQQWQETAKDGELLLTQLTDKKQVLELHYQLGELYRLGHNLDNAGSWEKSEAHYKEVLKIDPKNIEAKGALGTLYVNTGPQYAPAAEELFLSALHDAQEDEQKVQLYQGLLFARVYQQNIKGALEAADAGLAIDPQDQELTTMKNIYSKKK